MSTSITWLDIELCRTSRSFRMFASCLFQHLYRRVDADDFRTEPDRESFGKSSSAATQVQDRFDALIFHLGRNNVYPKIERLRAHDRDHGHGQCLCQLRRSPWVETAPRTIRLLCRPPAWSNDRDNRARRLVITWEATIESNECVMSSRLNDRGQLPERPNK